MDNLHKRTLDQLTGHIDLCDAIASSLHGIAKVDMTHAEKLIAGDLFKANYGSWTNGYFFAKVAEDA